MNNQEIILGALAGALLVGAFAIPLIFHYRDRAATAEYAAHYQKWLRTNCLTCDNNYNQNRPALPVSPFDKYEFPLRGTIEVGPK